MKSKKKNEIAKSLITGIKIDMALAVSVVECHKKPSDLIS